jgi:hypothetical protein
MAIDDYIVYWTDDHNPPRRLVVPASALLSDFPFSDYREQILNEDPDFDIMEYDIYRVRKQSGYNWGASLTLVTVGSTATANSVFTVPSGSRVALLNASVRFQRQGVRSTVNYNVMASVSDEDNQQSAGFAYTLCNTPPAQPGILERTLSFPGPYIRSSIGSTLSIFVGRTPGFIFYFPCRWGSPTRSIMQQRTFATISVPKNALIGTLPAGVTISLIHSGNG